MEVISDIAKNKDIIQDILSKHGCSAEHNYYCYVYNIESWDVPYVFLFEKNYLILSKYDTLDNDWYMIVEPVCPDEKKIGFLISAIDYAFSRNVRKVWLELETKTRHSLMIAFRSNKKYKINKINYTLNWPVYELDKWTGDKMDGKEWKDLRYYWNKFFREHKVEFLTSDKVSKDEMKRLVHSWKKTRTTGDRAYIDYYLHAIDKDFFGYDINRIMIVDGKVAAITAGFESRRGYYYSTIGLYDKGIDRCNEIANLDDLINLKKSGYKVVDFGGVEKKSLPFKDKFRPTRHYKTHIFSIILR